MPDTSIRDRVLQKFDPGTAVFEKSAVLLFYNLIYRQIVIKYYQFVFIICYIVQCLIVTIIFHMIIKECLDGFGLVVLFIFDVRTLGTGFKMAISAS